MVYHIVGLSLTECYSSFRTLSSESKPVTQGILINSIDACGTENFATESNRNFQLRQIDGRQSGKSFPFAWSMINQL